MHHNPDHHPQSRRQKIKEGSAHNVLNRTQQQEEDYWRGVIKAVDVAYNKWITRRRKQGDLTIELPKKTHDSNYVPGQGPQTHLDCNDKSHIEGREEDDSD